MVKRLGFLLGKLLPLNKNLYACNLLLIFNEKEGSTKINKIKNKIKRFMILMLSFIIPHIYRINS